MLKLAFLNLLRRPLRFLLAASGVALAAAVWAALSAFGTGYRQNLRTELDRAGMQLMLVPLGCPYDAAARVLKGRSLEVSLPGSTLAQVRADPAIAVAAPLLIAAVPRAGEKRTDLWVGLDESALQLKPWWAAHSGASWFAGTNSVILGSESAMIEMRDVGDALHSPELGATFRVTGILERSGTSDDSLFFLPLATAQRLFSPKGELTAIAIRLRDPAELRTVAERLQQIPGAQVVTMTEMMGTFLNLIGAVKTLLQAINLVALSVGVLGILNTLLAAVVEQTAELCLLRALGASRLQVFLIVTLEALLLSAAGTVAGLSLAICGAPWLEHLAKARVPLADGPWLFSMTPGIVIQGVGAGLGIGFLAGLYPAWRASRLAPVFASRAE